MVTLDLGKNLARTLIGEGMLFLIRADEEYIASEIVGKSLVMDGTYPDLEITHHDVPFPQWDISRDHHGADVGWDSRESSA